MVNQQKIGVTSIEKAPSIASFGILRGLTSRTCLCALVFAVATTVTPVSPVSHLNVGLIQCFLETSIFFKDGFCATL